MAVALNLVVTTARAVDNPDEPDSVADLLARAKPFEDRISAAAGGGPGLAPALTEYDRFLDHELNRTYTALRQRLSPAQRRDLQRAQRGWLAWRDAELKFSEHQWTTTAAGTSAVLTRGQIRNEIAKQRVVQLLRYQRELPLPAPR